MGQRERVPGNNTGVLIKHNFRSLFPFQKEKQIVLLRNSVPDQKFKFSVLRESGSLAMFVQLIKTKINQKGFTVAQKYKKHFYHGMVERLPLLDKAPMFLFYH